MDPHVPEGDGGGKQARFVHGYRHGMEQCCALPWQRLHPVFWL